MSSNRMKGTAGSGKMSFLLSLLLLSVNTPLEGQGWSWAAYGGRVTHEAKGG